jgi:hypothetical protein
LRDSASRTSRIRFPTGTTSRQADEALVFPTRLNDGIFLSRCGAPSGARRSFSGGTRNIRFYLVSGALN